MADLPEQSSAAQLNDLVEIGCSRVKLRRMMFLIGTGIVLAWLWMPIRRLDSL